jgi:hypothetical protein
VGKHYRAGEKVEKKKRKIAKRRPLSLVTYRALLGIKPIGSNAEHVVALDADTMDDGTDDGCGPGSLEAA